MQSVFRHRIAKYVPMVTNINTTIELLLETVVLLCPCKVLVRKTVGVTQLVGSCQLKVEFCTGGCEDRTSVREAEESPLLEAIAREWVMKTQQAGKRLRKCCSDF
jgi:hypothetical protein